MTYTSHSTNKPTLPHCTTERSVRTEHH